MHLVSESAPHLELEGSRRLELTGSNQSPFPHVDPSDPNEFTEKFSRLLFQKHAKAKLPVNDSKNFLEGVCGLCYNLCIKKTDGLCGQM